MYQSSALSIIVTSCSVIYPYLDLLVVWVSDCKIVLSLKIDKHLFKQNDLAHRFYTVRIGVNFTLGK